MARIGQVMGLNPAFRDAYIEHHKAVWPEAVAAMTDHGIRNYTLFLREPENLLFSVHDYVGDDRERDMAQLASQAVSRSWSQLMAPMQVPLNSRRGENEWWSDLTMLFRQD